MKRVILLSMMAMMTLASFGRNHVSENATVVADTIFYAENRMNVSSRDQASYYRILMTAGKGLNKKDVFQDFYLNGTLKAEGGYSFVDLGDDNNTVLNGSVTTYYVNGKEKWHGNYVNGQRNGYFTLQMRDGSVATVEFVNGKSKYDYFVVTSPTGEMQKRPVSEIRSLLNI
jgi:antitoxin component YwqK of YwqJK toxin-antitoxin module